MVKDEQGAFLPGVTIVAAHIATGQRVERVSDATGRFSLALLPVGTYTRTACRDGFRPFVRGRFILQVGRKIDLPLTLEIGAVTDTVTVTADAPLQQIATTELADIVGNRQEENLPLNVIDGVEVTDEYFNNLVISPSIDAIHNYFDDPSRPVPTLDRHQCGLTLGAPLKHDQTFFFFSYEGQRLRKAQTQTCSVPTAALRAGDFSSLTTALCDPLTRTVAGTCTPFVRNQLPTARLDRIALALLARVPLPTSAGTVQNLLAADDEITPMHQGSLKIDHRVV